MNLVNFIELLFYLVWIIVFSSAFLLTIFLFLCSVSARLNGIRVSEMWNDGYKAGKKRARYEVLAVAVALYFIVAIIGKFSGA